MIIFLRKREFKRNADLLWLLIKKEVALKYKRTALGIIWSLLSPILLALIIYVAFTKFLKFYIENYAFFLLAALFPWNWFSTCVTIAPWVLIGNAQLIKKINFPKYFLIISMVVSQLINFLFSIPVIMIISLFFSPGSKINWLFGVPILILMQFFIILGVSIPISILNIYFRDVEYLVGIFITFLFWGTPVVYSFEMVPDKYKIYLIINPMTHLINTWRNLFMKNIIDWANFKITLVSSLIVLILGIIIFIKFSKKLDEVL